MNAWDSLINKMPSTISEAYNLINDLPRFTVKHSFEEGRKFLKELGDPDRDLKVIHVAGTNGKGSVCVYMESILRHAGYKTGCFISPHLEDMRERIRINGCECGEEVFLEAFARVRETAEKLYMPTFFEFLFFMALLIFKQAGATPVILETGLGGRLDATNLISRKEACVITSIGLDHMQYLGDTIESIAAEKAGIIRQDTPVVFWKDMPGGEIIDRLADEGRSVKIALSKSSISDLHRSNSGIDFCFRYKYDNLICLHLNTCAKYQTENAAQAIAALLSVETLGSALDEEDIRAGLESFEWPGRMEEIRERIFLDGAHNEPAVHALTDSIKGDDALHRLLVYGCMSDKDYDSCIKHLAGSGLFDRVLTVALKYERAEDPVVLADLFRTYGIKDAHAAEISRAVSEINEYAEAKDSYVYIAGSLYLIGEMRRLLI